MRNTPTAGRPSATEIAAAVRMSTTAGTEATEKMPTAKEGMPTAKEGMPTEKAGTLIQYQEYVYIGTSAAERLSASARTLAVICI